MNVWTGTSGFQYPEWKGGFYPEDLSLAKMLGFYAGRFPTTEINYSFRRIPSAKTLERWSSETPAHFRFSLKAPQKVTHFAKLRDCGETVRHFHGAIGALGEKRGPVLFQLPPTLARNVALLRDFLREMPEGMRAAFEFRHPSWFDDEVYELLRSRDAALCLAESAELATPAVVTASFGYLRLRREDYTATDLKKWAGFVESQTDAWSDAFVYFKHEERGVGPKFAAQFMKAPAIAALRPQSRSKTST